jgi:hypothetical protein
MKMKFIFTLVALMMVTFSATFASFPVERTQVTTTANTTTQLATDDAPTEELSSPAVIYGGKSQLIALLLCIFLGWIGIHRFYLGYLWIGIIQLLTAGLLGIWTIIDLIRIIIGDLQPKNGSYSKTF